MNQATAPIAATIYTFALEPSGKEITITAIDRDVARVLAWQQLTDAERDACESIELVEIDVRPDADADQLVRALTACESFEVLVHNPHGYRPSLRTETGGKRAPALRALADLYDAAQEARGDTRRAYRC